MTAVSPFVLCGGAGTRLWPLSREAFPKQFHKIAGSETLFQQTCRRLSGDPFGSLSVLSNQKHRFLIADQLQGISAQAAKIVRAAQRKPVDLYSARREASPRQSGQDPGLPDRGPIGKLSG